MAKKAPDHLERFAIGATVDCSDGNCGKVTRVVIDPLARALTHLVVEPKHSRGLGRLVPLGLIDPTTTDIQLCCTVAEFNELDAAEETHFLPSSNSYSDYAEGAALLWPHYGLGVGIGGVPEASMGPAAGPLPQMVVSDVVPPGEVVIQRGERVHAVDGEIGRVQGIVIADIEHQVTHVLLQEGHLFGRKDVAIPIGAVINVDDGIKLSITKQQVEDLPSIDVHWPDNEEGKS